MFVEGTGNRNEEKLGIPTNMRKTYYLSGFERYKQIQASTRLDLGHN